MQSNALAHKQGADALETPFRQPSMGRHSPAPFERTAVIMKAADAINYALNHWHGLVRFPKDGRIDLDTNPIERAMRPVATPLSLCTLSSSVWKHWQLFSRREVTRASFAPDRLHYGGSGKVGSKDLERRARNHLLGAQNAGFDQLADPMAGHSASLGRFAQGQPGSILLGGLIGVNAANAPDRTDPVCRPGCTLSGRQTHPVESGGDVLVGPAARHAAKDR